MEENTPAETPAAPNPLEPVKQHLAAAKAALKEIESHSVKGPQHRAQIAIVAAIEAMVALADSPQPSAATA